MARRGCASGRRKQLRRLVKALHEHKEFDPSIFDRAVSNPTPSPPLPPPPTYRSFVPPNPKTYTTKNTPAPIRGPRAPARPLASDTAPVRRLTRPLPVSAQVKKRNSGGVELIEKPKILSIRATNFEIRKKGRKIFLKQRAPLNQSHVEDVTAPLNVKSASPGETGSMGGAPGKSMSDSTIDRLKVAEVKE